MLFGLGVQRLARLVLDRGLFLVVHRLAKALDCAAQITADVLQPLGAEQQYHDDQHDQQLPQTNATKTHFCLRGLLPSLFAAGRLFFKTGQVEAACQFFQDVIGTKAEMAKHDQ